MEQHIRLNIKGLQHAGIPASNIRTSEAFYKKLGFENVMEAPFDFENAKGAAIMMQREGIIIEIYQFPEGATLDEIRTRKNGHIDHIAFDVPDIEEAFATIKNAGFNVIEDAPVFLQFWKKGCKYFNITGPCGERLEFNQIL